MGNSDQHSGIEVFRTDFRTPIVVSWAVWLFLMGGSSIYLWVSGKDMVAEWKQTRELILLLTAGIAALSVLLPLAGWQRVVLNYDTGLIRIQKAIDRLRSVYQEVKSADITGMEIQRKPRGGDVLVIQGQGGDVHKINLTNLKNGTRLKEYVEGCVERPSPQGPDST